MPKKGSFAARSPQKTAGTRAFDAIPYPAMATPAGNRALFQKLNYINRGLDLPEMAERDLLKCGAGDISFVASDVDGLAGLGPTPSAIISSPKRSFFLLFRVRQAHYYPDAPPRCRETVKPTTFVSPPFKQARRA
jgi:hypothetical protein